MDTKSKKFNAVRIVCFILCLVLVGGSGFAAARAIRFYNTSGYIYTTENFKETVKEPLLSKSVLDEIGFAYYAMRRVHIAYEDGKIFENGKFEQLVEQDKTKNYAEQLKIELGQLRSTLNAYNDMIEYLESDRCDDIERESYYQYDDNEYFSERYNRWISVSDVTENRFFSKQEDGSYIIDEPLVREYYSDYNPSYSVNKEEYRDEYEYLKDYLSLYSSLKYLIVNNKTGEVFANNPHTTAEGFAYAYKDNTWMISSSNNFETVAVNQVFEDFSSLTREYSGVRGDRAKDFDGKIVKSTAYLSQFFDSIRYGWLGGKSNSGYILGTLEFIKPADSTVYISFDRFGFDETDPIGIVYNEYQEISKNIYAIVLFGLIAALLALILTVALIVLAIKGSTELGWQSKIPGEIHAMICLGGAALAGAGVVGLATLLSSGHWINNSYGFEVTLLELAGAACITACYFLMLNWLVTLIRSIRGGVYFKRLIIVQPFRFIKKLIKKAVAKLKANSSDKKNGVRRQLAIVLSIYIFISFFLWIFLSCCDDGFGLTIVWFLIICLNAMLAVVLYFYAKAFDKISDTVLKTQQGDFDVEFSCKNMPKPMVELADSISQMRSGMKIAIDSAVREQKAKMDLITNVSHDLKTPLTSIITYSDLIKRSGLADEDVDGYADILIEKSFRLKQLIEDLTEATRVSTGAVDLQRTQVSLYELVAQALGENATPLEEKNIDVRLNEPQIKPVVFVDGQKTYRVLENIISNISKYAMPGTRAYVAVGEKDGMGFVSFKNISNAPLNIPADQLMERFVRGDASRSGEGSGLGLSIARDLCELQGGRFDIQIDGDMFTATVYLPLT